VDRLGHNPSLGVATPAFLAYQTMNHVAAVRYRLRAGFLSRFVPAAPGQRGTAPALELT
jgi:hypothetical protein